MTLRGSTIRERWGRPAALALLMTLIALAINWSDLPYRGADSSWYLKMARGEAAEVLAPFANRLVHTGLARLLTESGVDAEWAFIVVALPAFWITLTIIFGLHRQNGVPILMTTVCLVGWFIVALLRDATVPDVHAVGWLGAVIVAAAARSRWTAPLLVVTVLCRESLALFALVLAWMAWRDLGPRYGAALLAAAVIGVLMGTLWSDAGNTHGIGGVLYLATKSVFNVSRNVFGWELYVDTIDYCEPTRTWSLPAWVPSGEVREVGVCGFNPRRPLWLLVAWSGIFGALPGWLWAHRGSVRRAWPTAPLWLRAALVYGLVMMFLAPASGTSLDRLTGYAWPAFWLAAPLLTSPIVAERGQKIFLAVVHVATACGVLLIAWAFPVSVPVLSLAAVLGVGMNVMVAVLAGRWHADGVIHN